MVKSFKYIINRPFHALLVTLFQCSIVAVEIVSLGQNCMIAHTARHNKLRNAAYPFDWLITSPQALIKGLQDDFVNLLDSNKTYVRADNLAVVDGYGFTFIHDFPRANHAVAPADGEILGSGLLLPDWRDSIDIVREKIKRRLMRLYALLQSGEPVVLVRYESMSRSESKQFIELVKRKFPKAKVALVVIGSALDFKQSKSWNLSHVRKMHIDIKKLALDSPEWSIIMHKLAVMNPKGWLADI